MSIRPVPGHAKPESVIALEHEHSKAYAACEAAAQRLELAGHDREAALVRAIRRRLAEHIADGRCGEARESPPPGSKANDYGPAIVARAGVSDD